MLKYVMDVKSVRAVGDENIRSLCVFIGIEFVRVQMERNKIWKEVGRIMSEMLNENGYKEKPVRAFKYNSVSCKQNKPD